MADTPPSSPADAAPRRAIRQVTGRRYQSEIWRRRLLLGLVVCALLGLAAPPAYQAAKRVRGRSLARAVERALAQQNPEAAARPLKLALDLAPKDPEVLRAAAHYSSRVRLAASLNYWDFLVHLPEATDTDRRECVEEALRYRRFDMAGEQLRILLGKRRDDPDLAHLQIRLLLERNDPAAAMRIAHQLVKNQPDDPRAQFVLGSILRGHGSKAERQAGRRFLWALAIGSSPWQEKAVDALLPDEELNRGENELLLKSLLARSPSTPRLRLQIATLRLRLAPANADTIARELIAGAGSNPAPEDRHEVASWLERAGLPERLLELVPAEAARGDALLSGLRLQALAQLDRWNDVEYAVSHPEVGVEGSMAALFRGELAARRGLRDQAEVHFRDAAAACTNRADLLILVARRSDRAGFTRIGVDALFRLMRLPQFTVLAAREILRLIEPHDDLPAAKRAVAGLAEFLPGDPAVATELAYCQLVLGEGLEVVRDRLQRLREAHPNESEVRRTFALFLLRSGKPAEALPLLEAEGWDWKKAPPRWQAVYAAALGANQQRSAAREVASQIDARHLKTPERELIRPWL